MVCVYRCPTSATKFPFVAGLFCGFQSTIFVFFLVSPAVDFEISFPRWIFGFFFLSLPSPISPTQGGLTHERPSRRRLSRRHRSFPRFRPTGLADRGLDDRAIERYHTDPSGAGSASERASLGRSSLAAVTIQRSYVRASQWRRGI